MSETGRLAAQLSAIGKTPLIVGIDGLGGAGKSTLSESLAAALAAQGRPVTLLHIDDFIHQRAVRYRDDVPAWRCYYELQWNYAPLLALIAACRREGMYSGNVSLYEKETDTYRTQPVDIPAGSIVIVEGVFLQRPALAGLFDYMIYLDIPEEIRLQRVLLRDGYIGDREAIMEKYEQRYFPAERHYVESCRPAETADVVMKETE